jgi:hypothetical protein
LIDADRQHKNAGLGIYAMMSDMADDACQKDENNKNPDTT